MTVTTLSSRDFNQDVSRAKRAAEDGPVIITDRGKPAHVLLSFEAYRRLIGEPANIVDQLVMKEDVELDLPARTEKPRAANL
jgi:antitoxin (DNA-binding transcriptional repressor) of toxin-antitoxin stability system